MSMLLRISLYGHFILFGGSYLEIFVFGGHEAVRDVIAQTSISARVDYVLAHFSKTTPIQLKVTHNGRHHTTLVPLPKPLLPELDYQTTTDTCVLLPSSPNKLLRHWNEGLWGDSRDLDGYVKKEKFLGYLATHEGAEPEFSR